MYLEIFSKGGSVGPQILKFKFTKGKRGPFTPFVIRIHLSTVSSRFVGTKHHTTFRTHYVCNAFLFPLFPMILFPLGDSVIRQTSKGIITTANVRCQRTISCTAALTPPKILYLFIPMGSSCRLFLWPHITSLHLRVVW